MNKQIYKISGKGIVWIIIQTILFIVCCSTIYWNAVALILAIILFLVILTIEFFTFCRFETDIKLTSNLFSFKKFNDFLEFYRGKRDTTFTSYSNSSFCSEYNDLSIEYKLDKNCEILLDSCRKIEKLSMLRPEQNEDIIKLEIPIPNESEKEDKIQFEEYAYKLKNLPEETPIMVGLEQFILAVHPKEELIDFSRYLMGYLKGESSELLNKSYLDLCNFATNTGHNLDDFIHLDKEIWMKFLRNLSDELLGHFKSRFEFLDLKEHLDNGKYFTVLGKDLFDTALHTFPDFDSLHDLQLHFQEFVHDVGTTIYENAPDWDILQPDFDFAAHIPYITGVVEAYRQIEKLVNDKTDWKSAAKNWSIKFGGKAAGVAIGGIIGTAIFPGIGTWLGGIFGGIIGGKFANEIVRKDFDKAVEQYKKAVEEFKELKAEAEKHLKNAEKKVDRKIRQKAIKEREKFNERKSYCPLSDSLPIYTVYSANIIIRECLLNIYQSLLKAYRKNNLLGYGSISAEGKKCKKLLNYLKSSIPEVIEIKNDPIACMRRMLYAQMVIDNNRAFLEQFGSVKEQLQYVDIISDVIEKVEDSLSTYNMVIFLWYYRVFTAYHKSINLIAEKTNKLFKWLEMQSEEQQEILAEAMEYVKEQECKVKIELDKI